MPVPNCCVLRSAGTNCDQETAFAFSLAGAKARVLHINRFIAGEVRLSDFQILAIPGGFSYGDDIASGKLFANELRYKLSEELRAFIAAGNLVIGICNGFQILVKAGILPGNDAWGQEASLIINDSGKFEDRWVYLITGAHKGTHAHRQSKCVWTRGLPEVITLPVAHGEGKFVARDKAVVQRLMRNGQVALRYCDERGGPAAYPFDPNGSEEHIAGICDETGRIFGLMPHPERHVTHLQYPRWTRRAAAKAGDGLLMIRNGVDYARKL